MKFPALILGIFATAAGFAVVAANAGLVPALVAAPSQLALSGDDDEGREPTCAVLINDPPRKPLGYVMITNRPVKNVDPRLTQTIADQLEAAQPVPPARLAHFVPVIQSYSKRHGSEIQLIGWSGQIVEAAPTKKGWIATLRVFPNVDGGSSTTILDNTLERYECVNGRIRYLGGTVSPMRGIIVD